MKTTEMKAIGIKEEALLNAIGIKTITDVVSVAPLTRIPELQNTLGWAYDDAGKFYDQCVIAHNIKGLSSDFIHGLEFSCGVIDIDFLSRCDPEVLHRNFIDNRAHLKKLPSLNQIKEWIEHAQRVCGRKGV